MAQLKGKLTREEEGLEDLLTSNVFGSFKYVSPEEGLLPFLFRAVQDDGKTRPLKDLSPAWTYSYEFWPCYMTAGSRCCEPDLLLTISSEDGIQVLIMIEAANGLMAEEGWLDAGVVCSADSSASINYPRKWMPYEIFRFYRAENRPNLLLFICILLEGQDNFEAELDQSLITAECFSYGKNEVVESWKYWWSRFHGYVTERADDGTVHRIDPKIQYPEESYPFDSVATFAWPLANIKNTSDLKEKVIEPLLQIANG